MYLGIRFVYVNVDWMQVFAIINNVRIMINADVNAKNWCECGCDKSCDVGEYLDYGNCNLDYANFAALLLP